MADKHTITKEITVVQNLKMISISYEEIAVMRINATKSSVLHAREFVVKLSEVFFNIHFSYHNLLTSLLSAKKNANIQALAKNKKNGKTVMVLLSANNKLYGDVISHVCNEFITHSKTTTADLVIIGNVGKSAFALSGIQKPYKFFEIDDAAIHMSQVKPVLDYLVQYEKVLVYYAKFESVLVQSPTIADVSGDHPFEEEKDVPQKTGNEVFLFEPDLAHVLEVFESQIFNALFKQTLHEIELARNASRIKAMEQIHEQITVKLKTLKHLERRVKALVQDKRQLQELANIRYYKLRQHAKRKNNQY